MLPAPVIFALPVILPPIVVMFDDSGELVELGVFEELEGLLSDWYCTA
jgi:hypothetical protein